MAQGIVVSGDGWRNVIFDVGSATTKGDLVSLSPTATVRPYTSTDSQPLGVAQHASADSLPDGKILVAVPKYPGAEMTCDVPTGLDASDVSYGITLGIYGANARTSAITTLHVSAFSDIVTSEGEYDSSLSRLKVSVNANFVVGAQSSNTFAS
jgi:hypothetical protein